MRVCGEAARTAPMQAAKCPAPPSRRSSRSTLVMTTYFSSMAAIVRAICAGSLASGGRGLPWPTSQNGQRRVHRSPRIMKVAVPWLKHSPMLGQAASSHTVCRPCSRRMCLISPNFAPDDTLLRIHAGLRSGSWGTILIGMRDVLAAPLWSFGSAMRNLNLNHGEHGAHGGFRAFPVPPVCPVVKLFSSISQLQLQMPRQLIGQRIRTGVHAMVAGLRHFQPGIAAGIDVGVRARGPCPR